VIGDRDRLDWLCGQLWDCTDTLPSEIRTALEDEYGELVYTYAQAARLIKAQ
jgi:hypothetical protein